jgi:hypothetical protein
MVKMRTDDLREHMIWEVTVKKIMGMTVGCMLDWPPELDADLEQKDKFPIFVD